MEGDRDTVVEYWCGAVERRWNMRWRGIKEIMEYWFGGEERGWKMNGRG
jgi:hypothetical protein